MRERAVLSGVPECPVPAGFLEVTGPPGSSLPSPVLSPHHRPGLEPESAPALVF